VHTPELREQRKAVKKHRLPKREEEIYYEQVEKILNQFPT